jgi:hypothetical protein
VKKLLKQTYKTLKIILLIITLLILSGVVVGRIYRDEIRNYVISEINRQIEVKVNVRSAEFSVFRKFPFVSIVLDDAVALSSKDFDRTQFPGTSTDTLFNASRIYLQFNLIDILNKSYRLRKVHAVNGKFTILVDKEGKGNYSIFKEKSSNKTNSISVNLDGVKLSGFVWQFQNLAKEIHSEGQVKELALKGKFSRHNFSLNSSSSLFIQTFNRERIEYASKLELDFRIILDVRDSLFTITRGELSLNDLNFKTGGSFTLGSKIYLNLQIAGADLNIKSLISTLPFSTQNIAGYSPSGQAEILAKVKGELSSTIAPSIQAAFKVTNGKVFLPSRGSTINGIGLRGTYSNGTLHNASTSRLYLNEYSVNYGNNTLKGKLNLDNFISPFISATFAGTIMAKDMSDVLNIDGLKFDQGFIYPDLSLNLSLDSLNKFKIQNISANGLNGLLSFKQISGNIPHSLLPLNLLEGSIKMEGETWFPEIVVKIGKNTLSAKLVVNYLWDYFVSKSKIPEVQGEINSEYLSITDFLNSDSTTNDTEFHLPDSVYLNLHCTVDSFKYGKFLASGLETWFTYKPGLLGVSSLIMRTMKGNISAGGTVIADNQGQMLLRTSGELRNIDIHNLFWACNNFGQDFIVSENLKGSASGNLDFSANISPKLELLTKNLIAQSDFIIEEGELIDFKPVTELSSFVELSELEHIKFSTLKNSILIKDEKVYIPQMDINSSAFNLTISGTHGFDNYFEYKLRLSMSEILARKAKKAKKENEEFGTVEDDGAGTTNLYLSITGTPENYKIKYDKKEAIIKIKLDLKVEKKLLKTILNEELGLFKKDSSNIGTKNHDVDQKKFIMDWGDEKDVQQPAEVNKKSKNKKDPALKVTWDEEDPGVK